LSVDIDLARDVFPISDLAARTEEVVNKIRRTGRPMILTAEGRSVIAMVDIDEFQRLREQAALAQDLVDIVVAEKGPFTPHEEVRRRYNWLFEETAHAEG